MHMIMPFFYRICERDFTPAQWSHNVTLPDFWENSESRQAVFASIKEHTKPETGECKIALTIGSNTDGSPATDSGLWKAVAYWGKTILDYCVWHRPRDAYGREGGHGLAGNSVVQRD